MDNNELTHHGVKGMKWGVRKMKTAKGAAESASKALNEGSKIAGTINGRGHASKAVKKQLSEMSDQELRERINRINMENTYANLNPSKVSKGSSYAKSVLEVAGSVAAIGASSLAIALAVKELKG